MASYMAGGALFKIGLLFASIWYIVFVLSLTAIGCLAGSSIFKGQNMEGDNFQNYGEKDQCIYL